MAKTTANSNLNEEGRKTNQKRDDEKEKLVEEHTGGRPVDSGDQNDKTTLKRKANEKEVWNLVSTKGHKKVNANSPNRRTPMIPIKRKTSESDEESDTTQGQNNRGNL